MLRGKVVSLIVSALFLTGMLFFASGIRPSMPVYSGFDYPGPVYIFANGTVYPSSAPILRNGNYYTLTGNITSNGDGIIVQKSSVTVDGAGYTLYGSGTSAGGHGFNLTDVNHVTIKNTTITNFNYGIDLLSSSSNTVSGNNIANSGDGLYLDASSGNTVSSNNITNNGVGIVLFSSSNSTVSGNDIASSNGEGIWLVSSSSNTVSGNNVTNNFDGIELDSSSYGNIIYHNNFVYNIGQAVAGGSVNVWDDGYPSGGNYWSNYVGVDTRSGSGQNLTGSDGISDTPYAINSSNVDRYPLIGPFCTFTAGTWNGVTYHVDIVSNSTLTGFSFSAAAKTLTFNVTGQTGTIGFCRVAIPTSLLSCNNPDAWTVMVGTTLIGTRTVTVSGNYTYIYFSYAHSTHQITITGTHAVPEFQPLFFSPLFITAILLATLLAAFVLKRKRNVRTQ